MPGEVKGRKAAKTHTSGREHETPKKKPQSSGREHETPKKKPQSSGREHETPKRKPHSSGREHETPKRKPQSSGQKPKPTKRRTLSDYQADEFKRKIFQKPYWCDGCREQGYGLRYKREKDNVELHRECLHPSPTASHKCIPGCAFKFLKKKAGEGERYCYACGMAVHGFVYHCEEKGWYLHPSCRKLEEKIEISRGVEFQLCCNKEPKKKCLFCKKKELPNGVRGIPGWFYVCKTASSSCLFHAYCTKKWVIDKWKKIGPEDNMELALKKMELAELDDSIDRDAKIRKGLIIGAEVLEIIVRILLGDPTALIFPSLTKLLLLS